MFCFQGLFHRVLHGEISLSKLVRMKPEELLSKELSVWKEKPAKAVSDVQFSSMSLGINLNASSPALSAPITVFFLMK